MKISPKDSFETLKSKRLIVRSINFLVVLGASSVNIYLPSLPTLDKTFHTTESHLKLSITIFLIGYAASQFFWVAFLSG